jgi:hypothetical protein
VDVDHAFVISKSTRFRDATFGIELLNRRT